MIDIILSENIDIPLGDLSANTNFLLYWKTDTATFPNQFWHDAPIIVLDWWTQNLKELCVDGLAEVYLGFMEGSYEVRLVRLSESYISIYFGDDFAVKIFLSELLNKLIETLNQMIVILAKRGDNRAAISNLKLCQEFLEFLHG